MVGTAEYQVTRCSRAVRQKASGLNRAGTTTVPPEARVARTEATRPCTWKSGITQSATSASPRAYVPAMVPAEAARFRCRSGTRLGRPVLPLVWSTSATSSGEGAPAERPPARPPIWTSPVAPRAAVRTGIRPPAARRASSAPSGGTTRSRASVSAR